MPALCRVTQRAPELPVAGLLLCAETVSSMNLRAGSRGSSSEGVSTGQQHTQQVRRFLSKLLRIL